MYYLHLYDFDGSVEYFCSKKLELLLQVVETTDISQWESWTIGNKATEFPIEDYAEFEIAEVCTFINSKLN